MLVTQVGGSTADKMCSELRTTQIGGLPVASGIEASTAGNAACELEPPPVLVSIAHRDAQLSMTDGPKCRSMSL